MIHPFSIFQIPTIFSSGALWDLARLLCSKLFNWGDMLAMCYQNRPLAPNTFFGKEIAQWPVIWRIIPIGNCLLLASSNAPLLQICKRVQAVDHHLLSCVIHDFEDLYSFPFSYLILEMESLLFYKDYFFLTVTNLLLKLSSILLSSSRDGE